MVIVRVDDRGYAWIVLKKRSDFLIALDVPSEGRILLATFDQRLLEDLAEVVVVRHLFEGEALHVLEEAN
jgi:hypothetical protein